MPGVLGDIDTNQPLPRERVKSTTSSLVLCSDDEEDDYDTAIGIKPRKPNQQKQKLHFDEDEDDEEDEEEGYDDEDDRDDYDDEDDIDGNFMSPLKNKENIKRKVHPDSIVKSNKNLTSIQQKHTNTTAANNNRQSKISTKKTPNPKPRKRRRSSARFLRLSGRFEEDDDEEGNNGNNDLTNQRGLIEGETEEEKQEKLGEMYRQAIRLNAENKINVGNSWGLNLIDNIDKFLGDEEVDGNDVIMASSQKTQNASNGTTDSNANDNSETGIKRVNFTRASCTLDASVKIYSYRVDDVHLTSYKVLANLNRTDNGKEKRSNSISDELNDDDHTGGNASMQDESNSNGKRTSVVTIESNLCK